MSDLSGSWIFTVTADSLLNDGSNVISVVATDASLNSSTESSH